MKTNVVLDFMLKFDNTLICQTFKTLGGHLTKTSFGAAKHICESDYIHLVFDSYFELSVEDGEKARRTSYQCGWWPWMS